MGSLDPQLSNGHSGAANGYTNGNHAEDVNGMSNSDISDELTMPIAIIGMSCRFPGDATSPEKLWQLCADKRSAWSEIPASRFNQKSFYHPTPVKNGTVSKHNPPKVLEPVSNGSTRRIMSEEHTF